MELHYILMGAFERRFNVLKYVIWDDELIQKIRDLFFQILLPPVFMGVLLVMLSTSVVDVFTFLNFCCVA
ncbi:hypothetical protein H6762_03820 [Candidatus Nomurabacteria bacterium]|nr:hypothetical protein [Candidatus Nomurabacteria bacterium]